MQDHAVGNENGFHSVLVKGSVQALSLSADLFLNACFSCRIVSELCATDF